MRADHHMVEQGQTQGQVGPAALDKGLAFPPAPAEIRSGVGHIADEGQDIGRVFLLELTL